MTYLLVNLPFVAVAVLVAIIAVVRRPDRSPSRTAAALGVALVGVVVLTAVFDNVIIGLGIVAYDDAHLSGVRIGLAPIEDFAYSVAAAVGLPALWLLLPRREKAR